MVGFVTHVRPVIFKIFVVVNQETMWCMELQIGMSHKHHRHSKHTKSEWGPYNSLVIGHGMTHYAFNLAIDTEHKS